MNTTKRFSFFSIMLLASVALLLPREAKAQKSGIYTGAFVTTNSTSLTNAFAAASTNNFSTAATNSVIFTCAEYNDVGVSITQKATAATEGTATYVLLRSMDNATTFETTALAENTIAAGLHGTTNFTTCTNLNMKGATHFMVSQTWNTNATANVTNVVFTVELKSPKFGARVATQ